MKKKEIAEKGIVTALLVGAFAFSMTVVDESSPQAQWRLPLLAALVAWVGFVAGQAIFDARRAKRLAEEEAVAESQKTGVIARVPGKDEETAEGETGKKTNQKASAERGKLRLGKRKVPGAGKKPGAAPEDEEQTAPSEVACEEKQGQPEEKGPWTGDEGQWAESVGAYEPATVRIRLALDGIDEAVELDPEAALVEAFLDDGLKAKARAAIAAEREAQEAWEEYMADADAHGVPEDGRLPRPCGAGARLVWTYEDDEGEEVPTEKDFDAEEVSRAVREAVVEGFRRARDAEKGCR